MMTPVQVRLEHDVLAGISRRIVELVGIDRGAEAKTLQYNETAICKLIISELRIRWTIIERPRKQTTLRQES